MPTAPALEINVSMVIKYIMLMLIKFNYTSTYRGYPMEPVPGTEPGERVAEGGACGLTPKEKIF